MAVDVFTHALTGDFSNTRGSGANINDNQIITLTDGGNISGDVWIYNFGKSSGTELGSGVGGDDLFIIDLTTFNDDFDILVWSLHAEDTFQINGWTSQTITGSGSTETYTFTYDGTDGFSHTVTIETYSGNTGQNVQVVCFSRGTLILTENGDVPIEQLKIDDEVICGDGEVRNIRWIGSRGVSSSELEVNPDLLPIIIKADAFEKGMPQSNLTVSPQHRFKLNDAKAELLFGEREFLVKAKNLINDSTIQRQTNCTEVEYFHFMVDEHSTVFANSVEAETLHPHDHMNTAMSATARSEICKVFPELAIDFNSYGSIVAPELLSYEAGVLLS
jgi:hypothetical protein